MTDEHAFDQGDSLREDDPEAPMDMDDPNQMHGVTGCLALHDYGATVEYLTPQKVRVNVDCPKCGERTLFYGRWSKDD